MTDNNTFIMDNENKVNFLKKLEFTSKSVADMI